MCWRALGVGRGDEVITTPFSFIASSNSVMFDGGRPVFVDIEPRTWQIDPARIEAAITPRTKAILPVDVFGVPADMDAVWAIARKHGLRVLEDSCEALGATYKGRPAGALGEAGVFGFYPNKQMTTGEGGMVVTDGLDRADWLRSLRNQGRSPLGDGSFTDLGYNYRLSEIAAALGEGQLEALDGLIASRQERERRYRDLLAGIQEVRVPPIPEGRSPFVFIVQASCEELRDHLREGLAERGIQTSVYFRPIHLETFYRRRFGFRAGQFPRTEHAGRTCFAIPFHSALTEVEQVEVAGAIRSSVTAWLDAHRVPVGGGGEMIGAV
jgi:perosamine synthetase